MKYLLLPFLCIILCSCDHTGVYFSQTQPGHLRELSTFPSRFTGQFSSKENPGSSLHISAQHMCIQDTSTGYWALEDLFEQSWDSIQQLKWDAPTLLAEVRDLYAPLGIMPLEIKADSVLLQGTRSDTLFKFTEGEILKGNLRSCWLNVDQGNGRWEVKRLHLEKDSLIFSFIPPQEALQQYPFTQKVQGTGADSSNWYMLSPSNRRQTRTIWKEEARTEWIYYRR
ncbi:MAG: hypothetical protein AAFV07_16850 [Bacteroidota bacterium]